MAPQEENRWDRQGMHRQPTDGKNRGKKTGSSDLVAIDITLRKKLNQLTNCNNE
jgi:hypothetical protein